MITLQDIVIEESISDTSSLFPVSNFFESENWKTSNVVVACHFPAPLSISAKRQTAKINSFLELKKNWDSYDADPVSAKSVSEALLFIRLAENYLWNIYFIAPGKNGEILIELKGPNKIAGEIYFNPDSSNEFIIFQGKDCIYEGELNIKIVTKYFSSL